MSAVVYRMRDAEGQLLYIGSSLQWAARLPKHRDKDWWSAIVTVELEHFSSHAEALMAEAAAILAENPKHNVQRRRGIVRDGIWVTPSFNVRAARLNAGLSQRELAKATGISRDTLRALENGMPGLAFNVNTLADYFGVQVTDLLAIPDAA